MKILYFSITSKLNTDSNLIFRRVLLSKLDRNRAGYMTDWLMVNGILMYFFREYKHESLTSDDVASRLQVSDLYKSDLQVSSRFANDLM